MTSWSRNWEMLDCFVHQYSRLRATCLYNVGGVKMLLIRLGSIESTRIVWIDWSLWPCFKNKEGSYIFISRILTSGGLYRVGWKCCRFESIQSNQHESFPLLLIRHVGSRFAWDTTPCESSQVHVIKCLIRINWCLLPRSKNEEGSCIIISRILTYGSVDGRRANQVES